ncbi:MAG: D-alanine--D-alanine ligase family protein [Raoultibacter sp.]|jgi:D-alanine-D-alanine ligase
MSAILDPKTCKVALLAGGISGEREISLASGEGARVALEEAAFPVTLLDPANKKDLVELIEGNYDVAFICLHGRYGEDGTMQGLLDIIGLPYVGSKVWSSAVSMDKAKAKVFYDLAQIQTPHSVVVRAEEEIHAEEIASKVGFPCVVKPASEGSALGVFIVEDVAALEDALVKALELDKGVLVERYVKGIELTVAVLGNKIPYALPVIEIIPQNDFYDFESKYAPGGSRHICPAQLDKKHTEKVQELAIHAHKVLECEGMSRSDFILDEAGEFWILETNTIPGMTETSLLPDACRAAGMSFAELCTKLVEYALEDTKGA